VARCWASWWAAGESGPSASAVPDQVPTSKARSAPRRTTIFIVPFIQYSDVAPHDGYTCTAPEDVTQVAREMSHWCVSRRHSRDVGSATGLFDPPAQHADHPSKMAMTTMVNRWLACASPQLPPRLSATVAALGWLLCRAVGRIAEQCDITLEWAHSDLRGLTFHAVFVGVFPIGNRTFNGNQ